MLYIRERLPNRYTAL